MKGSKFTDQETGVLRGIGLRVKALRKQRGMTQSEVAEACGLNKQYISDVEHGKRNPSILTLVRIANAMTCTLSDIFH